MGSSCKDPAKGDENVKYIATNLILGHRGGGAHVEEGKIENTLASIRNGLNQLDGCEIDIQMSEDGTIWVYHDALLSYFCDSLAHQICVPKSKDVYLHELRQCREGIEDSLCTLEEVFQLLSQSEYRDKTLSLDIKGYFAEACFEGSSANEAYFDDMAKHLDFLFEKYNITHQLILETDYTYILEQVKEDHPQVRCHLLAYSNFQEKLDKATEKGLDGVSCSLADTSLNFSLLQKARKQGMEVQLWTIADSSALMKAKALEPFAIQVDHPHLVK